MGISTLGVHYTYEEFETCCRDESNAGVANKIKILSVENETATYEQNGKTFTAPVATLVNGACHEYGVVTNPEILKDWNGFIKG